MITTTTSSIIINLIINLIIIVVFVVVFIITSIILIILIYSWYDYTCYDIVLNNSIQKNQKDRDRCCSKKETVQLSHRWSGKGSTAMSSFLLSLIIFFLSD